MKNFLLFLSIISFSLNSCIGEEEKQNLDINVTGRVMNESGLGISNVEIYIRRGNIGHYIATSYSDYEIITTTVNGNYKYTVKNDTYVYQICCELPSGYSSVTPKCKQVDHTIINSHKVPNVINFELKK